ncbi:DUF5007 domain-containing protein [Chitinophaga defluvii]|uniref:DUF5007 domain-containing protein n=1 Tax=Chitinophaga defluvii TaxID=3163343 RepID=A0ABV2T5Z8_9BACT
MYHKQSISWKGAMAAMLLVSGWMSCTKVPAEMDYLSEKANFNRDNFDPVMGRTMIYQGIFNSDQSTRPLLFTLTNFRHAADSSAAPELGTLVKVKEWKEAYTGKENSLQEIYDKQQEAEHPVLDIRKNSGEIIFWQFSDTNLIKPQPGAGYLFDIKVENNGNSRVFKNNTLNLFRPRAYSPSDNIDAVSGWQKYKSDGSPVVINPTNTSGVTMDNKLITDTSVAVYFHKKGNGNSLSFKFYDKDSTVINPLMFNKTRWDSLYFYNSRVQGDCKIGFNLRVTETGVTYDVPYPYPAVGAAQGERVKLVFNYNRLAFGNRRVTEGFTFEFAIFEPGDWEIIFKYRHQTPKFEND